MKAVIFLVFAVLAWGTWFWRRRVGAKRLAALESGSACMSCHSANVTPERDGVRCGDCGTFTDLAWLNQATVNKGEIDAMTRPDNIRRDF